MSILLKSMNSIIVIKSKTLLQSPLNKIKNKNINLNININKIAVKSQILFVKFKKKIHKNNKI